MEGITAIIFTLIFGLSAGFALGFIVCALLVASILSRHKTNLAELSNDLVVVVPKKEYWPGVAGGVHLKSKRLKDTGE